MLPVRSMGSDIPTSPNAVPFFPGWRVIRHSMVHVLFPGTHSKCLGSQDHLDFLQFSSAKWCLQGLMSIRLSSVSDWSVGGFERRSLSSVWSDQLGDLVTVVQMRLGWRRAGTLSSTGRKRHPKPALWALLQTPALRRVVPWI